jgi:hypothetical protein
MFLYKQKQSCSIDLEDISMSGTHWLTVDSRIPYFSRAFRHMGISIEDREDIFPQIEALQDDVLSNCQLSYYSLADLGLQHGSTTPEIFNAAIDLGAQVVPYGAALRTLIEHPDTFKNNLLRRLFGKALPFESCLIGVKPLVSDRGRKYVVELAPRHFRFRLADEDERWGDYEYWVFAG